MRCIPSCDDDNDESTLALWMTYSQYSFGLVVAVDKSLGFVSLMLLGFGVELVVYANFAFSLLVVLLVLD